MRFITKNWLRAVAGFGVSLALGLLAACGGSSSTKSGDNDTPVAGTFIDAPVQGLSYKTGGWVARETTRKWQAIASSADGTKLVAAYNRGIYTSTDSGVTWTSRTTSESYDWQSLTSSADGTKLAGVNSSGRVFTSNDSGVTWTERENKRNWVAITSSADGSKLAAVTSGGIFSGQVYKSVDSGVTWTKATLSDKPWRAIASSDDGTKLAAAAAGSGTPGKIYTSIDSGANWTERESDRNWRSIASSSDGSKLVAVVGAGRIYTSTDSGANWTKRENDRNWWSVTSSSDGTKLAAVTYEGQIYTSSDSGVSWTAVQSSRKWTAIASSADGSKLAAVVFFGSIHTYTTPVTKFTTAEGKYDCVTGQDVTFSVGNQVLGAVKCGEAVHVYHMAGSGNSVDKGVRVARLLQSLNTSKDTSKITLPDLTGITVNVRLDTNDTDFQTDVAALMTQLRNQGKALVNTAPVTQAVAVAHVQTELAKLGDDLKTSLCTINACNSELLAKLVKPAAVKVAVSGLPTGQAIDLQLAITGSNTKSTLKLEGATGTLNAGFASVPLSGQTYTVSRTDSNAGIGCTLSNQTGTYDPLNVPTVSLTCSVNTPLATTLSGTVTGLASGQSVSLKNNESEPLVIYSNGNFQWGTSIAAGATYKLVVAAQNPANLVCTMSNGAGIAPVDVYSPSTSEVSNIAVDCKQIGYGVAGKVTGLSSSDSLGLKLTSSDANADAKTVQVTGASGGTTYTFANTTIASGSTFSVALDGDAPTGYTCTVQSYTSATSIRSNVSDANVVCTPTSSGGGGTGGGVSPSITSVTPGTAIVSSPAMFAITGSNLPTTAILVLGGVECTSSMSASTGFAATCPAPSSAGSSSAQVKTNTAANRGTVIGSSYTITVTASGGGSPTPPGDGTGGVVPTLPGSGGGGSGGAAGSCGTLNTTAGKVGGSVTGLSNNIGSVQLVMHDDTNGVDIETLTVAYGVGCTTHYFTFQNTLTGTAWTARSTTQACNITANSSGVTPSGQNYINNVTVTCSGN